MVAPASGVLHVSACACALYVCGSILACRLAFVTVTASGQFGWLVPGGSPTCHACHGGLTVPNSSSVASPPLEGGCPSASVSWAVVKWYARDVHSYA